jgi:hypothetical protein
MDSSENIASPDEPMPDAETLFVAASPTPTPQAEPGIYWCDQEDPGVHPVLGQLYAGENDFIGVTHPEVLAALQAAVDSGLLRQVEV